MNEAKIYVDGSAKRRWGGPASIAAVIKDNKGKTITTASNRIGISTSNQAEYRAVILGLEKAISLGTRLIEIWSDSKLIVNQINGKNNVTAIPLIPLYQRVKQLQRSFEGFVISHISREYNTEANELAARTLDIVKDIKYTQNCHLVIKLKQTDDKDSDIAFLSRIINILKDFPGYDKVSLSIGRRDMALSLKLSTIRINYCHELRTQLIRIVGSRRQLIVKQFK